MIVRSIKLKEVEIQVNSVTLDFLPKDGLLIGLVQMDYALSKKFPFHLKSKKKVKTKIIKALQIAKNENIDIICFPELSFDKEFLDIIKNFEDMIIIGGSYYDDYNYNVCPLIYNGIVYPIRKINPSPLYERDLAEWEKMNRGTDITIFESKDRKFKFIILICIDFLLESYEFRRREDKVNLIFTPSLNPARRKFQMTANHLCYVFHIDSVIANIIENKNKYGGSCFFCFEHNHFLERLGGYKEYDEFEYKIFEASGENLLLLKLENKSVEISTTPDSTPRVQILKRFVFKDDKWAESILKSFE